MPASVFPSSVVKRSMQPASKPVASAETVTAAREAVRGLLQRSQAFNALPEDKRRQLAHDLVQIGSYLAEPDGVRLKRQSPQVRALAGESSGMQPQQVDSLLNHLLAEDAVEVIDPSAFAGRVN